MGQLAFAVLNLPFGGMVKSRNTVEQAGLASPVGPNDGGNKSRIDAQTDTGQRVQASKREGDIRNSQCFHIDRKEMPMIRACFEPGKRQSRLADPAPRRHLTPHVGVLSS